MNEHACAAYTHKTITRSVNNNAQASEKYTVQFQLMFVQLILIGGHFIFRQPPIACLANFSRQNSRNDQGFDRCLRTNDTLDFSDRQVRIKELRSIKVGDDASMTEDSADNDTVMTLTVYYNTNPTQIHFTTIHALH